MRGELKTLIRIEHLVVAWRSGNGVRRIDEVILRRDLLVLGRMTVFRRIYVASQYHPGQLSLLPSAGRETSTGRSAVMLSGLE